MFFNFTPAGENKPASCSITSDNFGLSNGREFEYFSTKSGGESRMMELGVKDPSAYKAEIKAEILRRLLTADQQTMEAARHFSPSLFA